MLNLQRKNLIDAKKLKNFFKKSENRYQIRYEDMSFQLSEYEHFKAFRYYGI